MDPDQEIADYDTMIEDIDVPAAAEEHAELIATAETSFYPEVGHAPFWEAEERFNRELRDFVSSL